MKRIKSLIIGATGLLLASSCADMLEIKPQTSLYDEQIITLMESGNESVAKMLESLYTNVMSYLNPSGYASASSDGRYHTLQGQDYMRCLEGNDVVFGTTQTTAFGWQEYNLDNFSDFKLDKNVTYWYTCWGPINGANKIMKYMTAEAAKANNSFADGRARCLLARAYNYMNLMENYQKAYTNGGSSLLGMPIYTVYDPTQEAQTRATATETYKFIMNDIDEAISLLKQAGIGITTDYSTKGLEDFDLSVAYFLKARTALWTGDWATCISACNEIINCGKYSFIKEENYGGHNTPGEDGVLTLYPETNAFLSLLANPEAIVGYKRGSTFLNTTFYSWLSCTSRTATNGQAMIDQRLYDKIAANDYRKDAFFAEDYGEYYDFDGAVSLINKYANLKFSATHGLTTEGTTHQEGIDKNGAVEFTKFRLSEVVLMKAEAQAQSGKDADAKATLNTLLKARTRAGAETLTCDNYPAMAGMTALQMCQLQWRIEMWGENGREFYNNKRWNISVNRSGSANHVSTSSLSVDGMTLMIPEQEILYGAAEQN